MKNVTSKQQQVIRVTGVCEQREKAFADALNQIQRKVIKDSKDVTVRIEPVSIQVVEAKKEISIERFLFLFLPRTKERFTVTLDVKVEITMIEMESIQFETIQNQSLVNSPFHFFKKTIKKEAN